jgi:hypothetical protein
VVEVCLHNITVDADNKVNGSAAGGVEAVHALTGTTATS